MSVTLRNRGKLPVGLPSVELALTDAAGQLVSRRALSPADFRVANTVVRAGTEVPMQLLFATPSAHVTGYTVELFYP